MLYIKKRIFSLFLVFLLFFGLISGVFGNYEETSLDTRTAIANRLVLSSGTDTIGELYKGATNQDFKDAIFANALSVKDEDLEYNKITTNLLNTENKLPDGNSIVVLTSNDLIKSLCAADSQACGQSLMNVALDDKNPSQENAQNIAFSLVSDGTVKWSVGDLATFGYKSGEALNQSEEYRKALAKVQGTDCDGFFGSMWCSITDGQNTKENYLSGLENSLIGLKSSYSVVPAGNIILGEESKTLGYFGKDIEGVTVDCKGESVNNCYTANLDKFEAYCKKNDVKDCSGTFKSQLTQRASITSDTKETLNVNLYINYLTTLQEAGITGIDIDKCKDANICAEVAKAAVDLVCEDGAWMNPDCIKAIAGQKAIEQHEQHSYSIGMTSLLGALTQSDPKALAAAKTFFGAEADYSSLGKLGKEFSAGICEAKVEGYLDKTVKNSGSATKYGCLDNPDWEENDPSNPCLDVIVDLRAKRTEIMPDNFTAISFSYYIHSPLDEDIRFIVAMSYIANGKKEKELLLNTTKVEADSVSSDLHNFDIELTSQDASDFKIAITAFYGDSTTVYENIGTNIILATAEAYYSGDGNTAGNEESQASNPSQDLTSEDMLDLANI